MSAPPDRLVLEHLAFESCGIRIRLDANTPEVLARLPGLLPPDAQPCPPGDAEESFGLIYGGPGLYEYVRGESPVSVDVELEFGLMLLQTQIRLYIAMRAPNRMFVHAGAIAYQGRAILIPGRSFTGKTTLVAAFLRAGATYYSDEFAALDEHGLVHAYPTMLSVRDGAEARHDVQASELGAETGHEPVPVGTIVITRYRPGTTWSPRTLTPGQAALGLLDNTVAALTRSGEALPIFAAAVADAVLLEGDRGEPQPLIDDVFARMG